MPEVRKIYNTAVKKIRQT